MLAVLLVNVVGRHGQVVGDLKVEGLHVPGICLEVDLVAGVVDGRLMAVLQGACDALQRVPELLVLGLVVQVEDPAQAAVADEAIFYGNWMGENVSEERLVDIDMGIVSLDNFHFYFIFA